ncbi:replication initiation protein RepC [Falsochrobactrum ovis]|uniref:replication initiation protein RepC n=1 Tax=Falsochrobactrum ovis TaxID=1293442 RepID=UPI0035F0395F
MPPLQPQRKLSTIKSPGGYLRSLTQKARAGDFAINKLLYAGLKRIKQQTGHTTELRALSRIGDSLPLGSLDWVR